MMLASLPRPIIFGHRGAPVRAPENTLISFQKALQDGATAIELDAKLTADQQIVVMHDETLDRTTNGHGPLAEKTLAQLRELDAGSWFSHEYDGEKIPTLAEVFELVGGKALINVELTNYYTPEDSLVDKVIDLVQKYHLEDGVIFSSFLPANLVRSRQLLPEIPLGLLLQEGSLKLLYQDNHADLIPHDALHPYVADVSAELIQEQHQRSKLVNVWTVNIPERLKQLVSWEVDGIFTDNPALAVKTLLEAG
jgi:glycerophosphoryl diester phosphodiesterase